MKLNGLAPRILVVYARRHDAAKRGRRMGKISIEEVVALSKGVPEELLVLDETPALADFATLAEGPGNGGACLAALLKLHLALSPNCAGRNLRFSPLWFLCNF
jgi:hypothetical protein